MADGIGAVRNHLDAHGGGSVGVKGRGFKHWGGRLGFEC